MFYPLFFVHGAPGTGNPFVYVRPTTCLTQLSLILLLLLYPWPKFKFLILYISLFPVLSSIKVLISTPIVPRRVVMLPQRKPPSRFDSSLLEVVPPVLLVLSRYDALGTKSFYSKKIPISLE